MCGSGVCFHLLVTLSHVVGDNWRLKDKPSDVYFTLCFRGGGCGFLCTQNNNRLRDWFVRVFVWALVATFWLEGV